MRGASRVREQLRRDLNIRTGQPTRGFAKRGRRTQASRSREARERLLKSTIEVLVERGYNGLTTREVAIRAGFSNGALVHHYGTKSELIMAATAFVYERAILEGRKIAESRKARTDAVGAFIADCMNVYFEWPFIAACEVLMVARTDPLLMKEIRILMERFRTTMNGIWLPVLVGGGMTRPQASFVLLTTLNMIRGMAVNSLWQRNLTHYRELLHQWERLVKAGAVRGGEINIPSSN